MNVIEFAEKRLAEEEHQNHLGLDNDDNLRYWAAYLDGWWTYLITGVGISATWQTRNYVSLWKKGSIFLTFCRYFRREHGEG